MEKISQRHHFLPQFFLNNFGFDLDNGKYEINVFNKNNLKKFKNIVSNIAYIKNFHTIKIDNVETDIFEKAHDEIYERNFSKKYKRVLNKLNMFLQNLQCYNCLNDNYQEEFHHLGSEDKLFLSQLLAYFIQRGKKYNESSKAMREKVKLIFEDMGKAYNLSKSKVEEDFIKQMGTEEDIKIRQLKATFDGKSINKLTKYFYLHTWNICFNDSDTLFYTNDNAHGLSTMWKDHPAIYGVGYITPGNYIIFPLTPRICIVMYDTPFLQKNNLFVIDCNFVKPSNEIIETINFEIIMSAVDEVYSYNSDWKFLDFIYKKYQIPKGHKPYSVS